MDAEYTRENSEGALKVTAIWKAFREKFHSAPTEVMMLGIYTAMYYHYKSEAEEDLCGIGWRSGSLDAMGFCGIPIFSLDNVIFNNVRSDTYETLKNNAIAGGSVRLTVDQKIDFAAKAIVAAKKYYSDYYKDAEYLVNPAKIYPDDPPKYLSERMDKASFYIDLWINVIVPNSWGAAGSEEYKADPAKVLGSDGKYVTTDVNHLDPDAIYHLTLALFLYGCRRYLFGSEVKAGYDARTARFRAKSDTSFLGQMRTQLREDLTWALKRIKRQLEPMKGQFADTIRLWEAEEAARRAAAEAARRAAEDAAGRS